MSFKEKCNGKSSKWCILQLIVIHNIRSVIFWGWVGIIWKGLRRCSPCGGLRCCSVASCLLLWWWFWKKSSAWIFKQSMGARKRLGIGLSYRPTRLHSLVELVPWNRFMGSLKVWKFGLSSFSSNVNCCLLRGRGGGDEEGLQGSLLSQEIIVMRRTRVTQHFTIEHKNQREVYFLLYN